MEAFFYLFIYIYLENSRPHLAGIQTNLLVFIQGMLNHS